MKRRIWPSTICMLLTCSLLITQVSAYTGAFGQNADVIISTVLGDRWDQDMIENPKSPMDEDGGTWTSLAGDEVTWQNDHQMEYYYDQLFGSAAPYIWGEDGVGLGSLGAAGSGEGIVAVARNELNLGVKEIPKGCNRTKYGDYLWGAGSVLPWCCAFVVWCANQCGLVEAGIFKKTAGCTDLYHDMIAKGYSEMLTLTALSGSAIADIKPGDILFFAEGGEMHHIGIIESAGINDAGKAYIDTIEGNSSDMVARRRYYADSTGETARKALNGRIVRPAYPMTDIEVPTPEEGTP